MLELYPNTSTNIPNKIGLSANRSNMVKMQIAMESTIHMIASSVQCFFLQNQNKQMRQ